MWGTTIIPAPGQVAQVVEQRTENPRVPSSILGPATNDICRFPVKILELFCSPTMELGVGIAQLNLVNLRNVPPTPANYTPIKEQMSELT